MSRVDVHPEDLLDVAHRGRLTPPEQARLSAHLEHCTACALEVQWIGHLEPELAPSPDDDALLDRCVAQIVDRAPPADAAPEERAEPPTRTPSSRWILAAAASLLVGLFGGAAAAMFAMAPSDSELPTTDAMEGTEATEVQSTPPLAPGEPAASPVIEAVAELPDDPEPEPAAPMAEEPLEETAPGRPAPSAADLFAQANQARRDQAHPRAVRLYRRLQTVHPRSREAAISHVTLGRLLLDGMDEPRGALREFDRYLAGRRHRLLDEEARVGRALALRRLGRNAEERHAWRDLLDHHPDSLHRERARARLER